ncbi:hypothetical protein C482_04234 [Natrialba chahannaoensis JCM 10990]|uniref:DUF8173 domain-containing protein n=1 Tax=Natrialba chahannaoensis JCM 10990 TaxID=1227492 RepID=M0B0H9_9EURY|nr:polymer-forming cytoskeletal protein [Natrialba chahannaoensis]ELZ03199.1 hypothetical protein C482_04234 [Natrialba chahannaoensis JCM 10990]
MERGTSGRSRRSTAFVLLIVILLTCSAFAAPVAAQSETHTGGTITVGPDETVSSLNAFGGTVVVEGTVTGDVSAAAGDVRIDGDVGGDVEAGAGSVTIAGDVDGDVNAATGGLELTEGATIGGSLATGAGSVAIDGTIEGDAEVAAETTTLGGEAAIGGDLRYGGNLEGNTDAVAGEIEHDSTLGSEWVPTFEPIGSLLASAYILALNLLLGAALLAIFPRFSDSVANQVSQKPVRSGLVGIGVLIGIPLLLVALAITIVGIPFSLVGGLLFALIIWVGIIYGRFAVAAWLLSAGGIDNRWLALVVGLVGGALLAQIPWIGGLLNFLFFLLGLGALTLALVQHRRTTRKQRHEREPRPYSHPGPQRDQQSRSDPDGRNGLDQDDPTTD